MGGNSGMGKHVLLDMNTQFDFLDERGACPVIERKTVILHARKIFELLRRHHIPVISCIDSHRDSEPPHDGFPKHCVEGSAGQNKLPFTLLSSRCFVEANNSLDLPHNLLQKHRQLVLRRRTTDFLENPKADRLVSGLSPELFVIFGVGLERSIRRLTLCLLARGYGVAIIPEACGYWNETEADLTRRLLRAKGASEVPMDELEELLKDPARPRIQRMFSKPGKRTKQRRSLAS